MRALVTGACGFVGRYLIEHLQECGDEVLGSVHQETVITNFPKVQLDVRDQSACERVLNDFNPDVVFHLAAISFVPEAESNFENALAVNVGAVRNLCRTIAAQLNKPKLIFASSAEIYGRISQEDLPITEEILPKPGNSYSLTKLMAEEVIKYFQFYHGIEATILRAFNHIGPGQDDRFVASSFARQLAKIKLQRGEPRLYVGNLDPQRDFSDVRDIVKGYRAAAEKGRGIYNLGSGQAIAVRKILEILIGLSGVTVDVVPDPNRMRGNEVPQVYGSYLKAERELGWKPRIPLEDTLKSIYEDWLGIEKQSAELLV